MCECSWSARSVGDRPGVGDVERAEEVLRVDDAEYARAGDQTSRSFESAGATNDGEDRVDDAVIQPAAGHSRELDRVPVGSGQSG